APSAPQSEEPTPGDAPTQAPSTPSDTPKTPNQPKNPLTEVLKPVEEILMPVLSLTEALNMCSAQVAKLDVLGLLKVLGLNDTADVWCADKIEGKEKEEAQGLIPCLLNSIVNLLLP